MNYVKEELDKIGATFLEIIGTNGRQPDDGKRLTETTISLNRLMGDLSKEAQFKIRNSLGVKTDSVALNSYFKNEIVSIAERYHRAIELAKKVSQPQDGPTQANHFTINGSIVQVAGGDIYNTITLQGIIDSIEKDPSLSLEIKESAKKFFSGLKNVGIELLSKTMAEIIDKGMKN